MGPFTKKQQQRVRGAARRMMREFERANCLELPPEESWHLLGDALFAVRSVLHVHYVDSAPLEVYNQTYRAAPYDRCVLAQTAGEILRWSEIILRGITPPRR